MSRAQTVSGLNAVSRRRRMHGPCFHNRFHFKTGFVVFLGLFLRPA
jgi:hypothetical protein